MVLWGWVYEMERHAKKAVLLASGFTTVSFRCYCPFFQQLDFQNDWKLITVFFSNTSQCHLCPSAQQVNRRLGGRGIADAGVGTEGTKPA